MEQKQSCSVEEMRAFNKELLKGVDNTAALQEAIQAVKAFEGDKQGTLGGGKYNPALIHFLTVAVISGATAGSIAASLYAVEKSGISSAIKTYLGISEIAMYGCDNALGIAARQFAGDSLSPYLSCSYNAQRIEMINKQILQFLQWVHSGVYAIIEATNGFQGYGFVYKTIENFLENNEPPMACALPQSGGRKYKKKTPKRTGRKTRKQRKVTKGKKTKTSGKSKRVVKKGKK